MYFPICESQREAGYKELLENYRKTVYGKFHSMDKKVISGPVPSKNSYFNREDILEGGSEKNAKLELDFFVFLL